MRKADCVECLATGHDPQIALALSKARSEHSFTVIKDGDLLCEWGWRTDSFLCQGASVWLLSFDPVEKHKVFFARQSQRLLRGLLEKFDTVRCEVHHLHYPAIKWLTWLGFRQNGLRWYGYEHFFIMERSR